jgi:hypothetical protein
MTDGSVVLGGFVFFDHEVPNTLPFGGTQEYKKQVMVGGQKVVDAMGPNNDDISWSGRFRGAAAIGRASSVKSMMDAGAQVTLTWLGISRTVLITKFEPTTDKFYEVPYRITCCVVDDPSQGGGGIISSLDSLVGGDLAAAVSILPSAVGIVSTAVSGLSAAVAAVPILQGAAGAVLAPVLGAARAAGTAIASTIAANDPALDAASPDTSMPPVMAAWLATNAAGAVQQGLLADAGGYINRVALNVSFGGT